MKMLSLAASAIVTLALFIGAFAFVRLIRTNEPSQVLLGFVTVSLLLTAAVLAWARRQRTNRRARNSVVLALIGSMGTTAVWLMTR